jgi:hypothetical protein
MSNARRHLSDPLTRAVQTILWPFLKAEGFSKLTARKFAREKNGVFQQLWVDANGVAGKRSTYVILCANLPFGPIQGYMDPHGFRISNGRAWPMTTEELATASMQQVVAALSSNELEKLDAISDIDRMLVLLAKNPKTGWHAAYTDLFRKWREQDPTLLAVEAANREALKL